VVAPWNNLEVLERILAANSGRVAAIMMEAVLCNSGCLMPRPGFLAAARELADRYGALLIFDEVITGFRIGPGGAQRHFGITPDLATFGKAVGGGVPLSVIAGRADIMDQMFTGNVVFGGTFNGNPFSLAGADVCLAELSRNDGELLGHANRLGAKLMAGIEVLAQTHRIPLQVTGFGAAFALHFTGRTNLEDYRSLFDDSRESLQLFLHAALREGLILVPDGRLYVSTAHSEEDIAQTLEKIDRAFQTLAR
jgi:glutamate-1-semialdehyde 2,1-aminomutase